MSTHNENDNGTPKEEKEFRQRAEHIEHLIQRAQAISDAELRALVVELLRAVMSFHADCLERLLLIIEQEQPTFLEKLAADPAVNVLFALYGLHSEPVEARVRSSLENVKPYLRSQGGEVELLEVSDSRVRVRLTTHGSTCSVAALKKMIESSICEGAPEIVEVIAEQATVVPVSQLVQLR